MEQQHQTYEETNQEQKYTEYQLVPKLYRYKIEQTRYGARITAHGDNISDVVLDYMQIRQRLEANGFKVAPESGGFGAAE